MRKKGFLIGGVLIAALLLVSAVYAFGVGNVDGLWGWTNDNQAGLARCSLWATASTDQAEVPIDAVGRQVGGTNYPLRADQTRTRKTDICTGYDGDSTFAQWDSTTNVTWTALNHTGCPNPGAASLLISAYVYDERGTSGDRLGITIYNGTNNTFDLREYRMRFYTSSYQFIKIELDKGNPSQPNLLAPGGIYVLVTANATGQFPAYDQTIPNSDNYRTILLLKGCQPPSITAFGSNPSIQSPPQTDKNQVRYGIPTSMSSTGPCPSTEAQFLAQSGFGFEGISGVSGVPMDQPFYLGTFTHYNNPIWAGGTALNFVDLTITVPIDCDDSGGLDTSIIIKPRFFLDETPNNNDPCAYPEGPNYQGCADQVLVQQPHNPTFTCTVGGVPTEYTVNILGFTTNHNCQTVYDANAATTRFLTRESFCNSACLWANIDSPEADAAVAKTCQAFNTQEPYYTITVTNDGPGTMLGAKIVDTLPDGVVYKSYTSQRTLAGVTSDLGTCSISGKTVTCELLGALPDTDVDATAKWVVNLNVNYSLTSDDFGNTVTLTTTSRDSNQANNSDHDDCRPTSASIISFTGTRLAEGILLRWEVDSSEPLLGFNLYRAETDALPSTPIASLINEYEFLDSATQSDLSYFYWLEVVDPAGRIDNQPHRIEVRAPLFKNFLPCFNLE